MPFTLNNTKKCLIIDPDVFALQDPKNKINKIFDEENFEIACTKIDGKFRSEIMFLKNLNINWSFEDIINDLFNHKIDYKELINLTSKKYFQIFLHCQLFSIITILFIMIHCYFTHQKE